MLMLTSLITSPPASFSGPAVNNSNTNMTTHITAQFRAPKPATGLAPAPHSIGIAGSFTVVTAFGT